jgi:putative transposase
MGSSSRCICLSILRIGFDALRVKIRDEGLVRNKGGSHRPQRSRQRHQEDPKKPCGRKCAGSPSSTDCRVFRTQSPPSSPQATVQTCIVHLPRRSLDFVSYKDRKPVAAAFKGIYRAVDAAAGEAALIGFDKDLRAANTR